MSGSILTPDNNQEDAVSDPIPPNSVFIGIREGNNFCFGRLDPKSNPELLADPLGWLEEQTEPVWLRLLDVHYQTITRVPMPKPDGSIFINNSQVLETNAINLPLLGDDNTPWRGIPTLVKYTGNQHISVIPADVMIQLVHHLQQQQARKEVDRQDTSPMPSGRIALPGAVPWSVGVPRR